MELYALRNTFSAHVDPDTPLPELQKQLDDFSLHDLGVYIGAINREFRQACARDIRTRVFLIHEMSIRGAIKVVPTDAVKPFR